MSAKTKKLDDLVVLRSAVPGRPARTFFLDEAEARARGIYPGVQPRRTGDGAGYRPGMGVARGGHGLGE